MLDEEDQEDSVSLKEHIQSAFKNVLALDDGEATLILKGSMVNDIVKHFFQNLSNGIND